MRKLKPGMLAAQDWGEVNAFLSWHPQAVGTENALSGAKMKRPEST